MTILQAETKIPFTDLYSQYEECKSEIDYGIHRVISETDFLTGKVTKWDISIDQEKNSGYQGSGHGGGDWGLVTDWIKAVKNQDPSVLTSTIDASVESHIMGFRAEKSRKTNQKTSVNRLYKRISHSRRGYLSNSRC